MKDLLNQDRALSPALIKTGVFFLGILLAALSVFVILMALGTLFSGSIIPAFIQAAAGLSIALFAFLVVRLLSEILMAMHRLNDRMTILSDDLRTVRDEPAPARKAPKTTAKKDT